MNFISVYLLLILCVQKYIKTNEKARVIFKFRNKPEYIRVGERLLFRDGKSKGVGEVTKIFPFEPDIER